jgi:hypothetical protein
MKQIRSALIVLTVLVLAGIAYAATPQPISGSVKNSAGNPAANITVKLYYIVDPGTEQIGGESGRGTGGGRRSTDLKPEVVEFAGKGGTLKATGQTDANGNFAFKPQTPGRYRIVAGTNPRTTGMASVYVTLNEGQPATVDIRLEVRN